MKQYTWNYEDSLGDTIMEKYEALYLKLIDIAKEIGDIKSMITSRDISSIFETATVGFNVMGFMAILGEVMCVGAINIGRKIPRSPPENYMRLPVNLYVSEVMPENELILFGEKSSAVLVIENFVC